MGIGSFSVVKRRKRDLNNPPHLSPRSKKEYNYTSTPLLCLDDRLWGELYLYLTFTFTFIILTQFKIVIQATGGSPGLETWANRDGGGIWGQVATLCTTFTSLCVTTTELQQIFQLSKTLFRYTIQTALMYTNVCMNSFEWAEWYIKYTKITPVKVIHTDAGGRAV
jgi:hypothetical protein